MISHDDIHRAYDTIRPYLRRTPVIDLDLELAGPVTLKLEQLQCAGSFKARGAFTNLLVRDVPPVGVAAASGGNHGVAVAYAAHRLGIPARIFVPTVSSPAKIERIRQLAELVIAGDRYADALVAAEQWIATSGAMSVHAYDHEATILGQATLALELADQAGPLDTVLVPVGGGGLIAGIASYFAGTTRVIDPWGGSAYVEKLTYDLARRAWQHIQEVEQAGGMAQAIDAGIPKLRVEEAAARTQARIDSGRQPVIGVNKYRVDSDEQIEVLKVDNSSVRAQQLEKLRRLRAERDEGACRDALDALTRIRMHALVRELVERHRPGVLLVTHDVDEAIALADRALVMRAGTIAAEYCIPPQAREGRALQALTAQP